MQQRQKQEEQRQSDSAYVLQGDLFRDRDRLVQNRSAVLLVWAHYMTAGGAATVTLASRRNGLTAFILSFRAEQGK
jgi:hypothetical protein